MDEPFDVVVLGSGFAGALASMLAARVGLRVLLLERGQHPRFAIGESSTPLANLLLEELCQRYSLRGVESLVKWGSWQRQHPQIACGLKRGFSYVHHVAGCDEPKGQAWPRQLLVAASPRDSIADTHWYRPDFDLHLVQEAQRLGVVYRDHWIAAGLELDPDLKGGRLRGCMDGMEQTIRFRRLIDASGGGGGWVARELGIQKGLPPGFPSTRTQFAHFRQVPLWESIHPDATVSPYPIDDSALHHVFEDGWVWVLRFNNGVTSAGAIVRSDSPWAASLDGSGAGWRELLATFPGIGSHLGSAVRCTDFQTSEPVGFCLETAVHGPCVFLPSAYGFVDPMFSTGFPLVLLGLERLGRLFEQWADAGRRGGDGEEAGWVEYDAACRADLEIAATFMGAIYRVLRDFKAFHALSLLYFAAAIYAETSRRLGRPERAPGFLLRGDARFRKAFDECCLSAGRVPSSELWRKVADAIGPIDLGGLLQPGAPDKYWAEAAPMIRGASMVGATAEEMRQMLERVEFQRARAS